MTLLLNNSWKLNVFSGLILSALFWTALPQWYWSGVALLLLGIRFLITPVTKRLPPLLHRSELLWHKSDSKHYYWPMIQSAMLAFVVVNINAQLLVWQHNSLFQDGENITIKGRIDSFFKSVSYGYEGVFLIENINGRQLSFFQRPTIRLKSPQIMNLGERWQLDVRLHRVVGLKNLVGFDLERYYFSQGWLARASVVKNSAIKIEESHSWRQQFSQRLNHSIQPLKHHGLIMALTFGVRDELTPQHWLQLQESGLIHLVAISGLHIGIAFAIGYWLGRLLRYPFPNFIWLPFVCAIVIAIAYAWLAGFTLPTRRALTMCLLFTVFTYFRVAVGRWQTLFICFAITLAIDPFSALSSSFWLSFGAIAVIFIFLDQKVTTKTAESILIDNHPLIQIWHRYWPNLNTLIRLQWYLLLYMTPITVFIFGGVSLFSPIYNLIFVPWFCFIVVPLLFLALAVTLGVGEIFPLLNDGIWLLVDWSLMPISYSITWASIGWFPLSLTFISLLLLIVLIGSIAVCLHAKAKLMIVMLLLNWCYFPQYNKPRWSLDILDVGHGLAILITQNGRSVLYDTGAVWEHGSIAHSIITPLLYQRGEWQLEGMILSHADADHAGGKTVIEEKFQPIWKRSSSSNDDYLPCVIGAKWQWQSLVFEVLWPPKIVKRAYNPHSCVIRLIDIESDYRVLLSGDIEAIAEMMLVKQARIQESKGEHNPLSATIMIVPHHGSKTSSTASFIEQVSPQLAIASLAKNGRWPLPSPLVTARYAKHGITWLDTGDSGQITINFYKNNWKITTLRTEQNTAWYRHLLRKEVL